MKVSIIVPTYNERDSIVALVNRILGYLQDYDYEVLIVDDNSPDGTYQAVVDMKNKNVRGILRTSDKGFAKSIRCGIENAKGDAIVVMDSDFNHDPKHIPFMLKALSEYDCVFGSRFLYGGRGANKSRHLLSWSFNIFIRILTDGRITDSLFGYFAVNKSVLNKLNFDHIFWGFGDYCIRLTYFLQAQGFTVLQIPVVIGERIAGTGNRRLVKVFFQYTASTLQLVRRFGRLQLNDEKRTT